MGIVLRYYRGEGVRGGGIEVSYIVGVFDSC